jgi:DNA-binding response OmpR family regulator
MSRPVVEHTLQTGVETGRKRFSFGKATVVIIDNNAIFQKVLAGILSGLGFRKVRRFESLKEGIEEIKSCTVDLVFIDPQPFGAEAYDFVRWLRSEQLKQSSRAPVIIVSGHTPIRQVTASRQCGADYIIAKPFSTAVVLDRLLWVAEQEECRGGLTASSDIVSPTGSGVELW